MFVVAAAVEFEMNVNDVDVGADGAAGDDDAVVADSAVGLSLCLHSTGSYFEHISFSRVAKQIHCEP